jgi:hypothetical protein
MTIRVSLIAWNLKTSCATDGFSGRGLLLGVIFFFFFSLSIPAFDSLPYVLPCLLFFFSCSYTAESIFIPSFSLF